MGVAYATALLVFGTLLHPELKALYRRRESDMESEIKNTVSCFDALIAAIALALLSRVVKRDKPEPGNIIPFGRFIKRIIVVAPPAVCIFLVICLSTLANCLNFEVWIALAPLDFIFTVPLAWYVHGVKPIALEVGAVALAAVGTFSYSWVKLSSNEGTDHYPYILRAIFVTVLCRMVQSVHSILLRSACRRLGAGTGAGRAAFGEKQLERQQEQNVLRSSVLEIAALKMGIITVLSFLYALIIEGFGAWGQIASGDFWASSPQGPLLLLSAGITFGFQLSNVGLSAETSSVATSIVSVTLTQLGGFLVIFLLSSDTSLGHALDFYLLMHPSYSSAEAIGLMLSACAVCTYGISNQLRLRHAEIRSVHSESSAEQALTTNASRLFLH